MKENLLVANENCTALMVIAPKKKLSEKQQKKLAKKREIMELRETLYYASMALLTFSTVMSMVMIFACVPYAHGQEMGLQGIALFFGTIFFCCLTTWLIVFLIRIENIDSYN